MKNQNGFSVLLLVVIILVLLMVFGGMYWYFSSSNTNSSAENTVQIQETNQVELVEPVNNASDSSKAQVAPAPEGWMNYDTERFSLIYPEEYIVTKARDNVFEFVPINKKDDPDAKIVVDASLTHNNSSFDQAVASAKNLLHKVTTQDLTNGTKFVGFTIGGYGESLPKRITLIKYNDAAISIQTTSKNATETVNYDLLVESFTLK